MADTQLRGVYDLCSPDSDGFIVTDTLARKLADQFNDQAVGEIRNTLDPDNKGRISFEEFCGAVNQLQSISTAAASKSSSEGRVAAEEDSLSDPEHTYNEYDITEDELLANEMENFEAFGESNDTLSPSRPKDGDGPGFIRHSSIRRSHRRNRSWNMQAATPPALNGSILNDDNSSVSSELDDLSEKVDNLKDQVTRITEEKTLQIQYESVMRDNQLLKTKVDDLEGKLQDAIEVNTRLKETNSNRLSEVQSKLEREKELQVQVLQGQIDMLTRENERTKFDIGNIQTSHNASKNENKTLRSSIEELTSQLLETNEQYRKLSQQFTQQQEKHDRERTSMRAELQDITDQLMNVQQEKDEMETHLKITENQPDSEMLLAHVSLLKDENSKLKSTNEQLNSQLAKNIAEVRSMMMYDDNSIAQELNEAQASKDDVYEALKQQELVNLQLKEYLDKIILQVLEKDPSILEVKN